MKDQPVQRNPKTKRRARRQGKSQTIGVLVSHITHKNDRSMWQGVVDAAQKRDVNVICFVGLWLHSPYGFEAQANVIYDLVSAEKLDGLVIMAGPITQFVQPEEKRVFIERYYPLPIVTLESEVTGTPNISVDSFQNMRKAVLHLIQAHNYRRIAFIRGPETHQGANERYRAYVETLAECGLVLDPALVTLPLNWYDGRQGLAWLLDQQQVDFEAVIGANDDLAMGAIEELRARGIRIPEEVAVVGYDDAAQSRWINPPLTTVPIETYEWGQQALEMVLDLIEGKPVPEQVVIPTELMVRQSCGCPDPAVVQASVEPAVPLPKGSHERMSLETVVPGRQEDILAEIRQAAGKEALSIEPGQIARLWEAFIAELNRTSSGILLRTLDQILRQTIATGGEIEGWDQVISVLRRQALPCLHDGETLLRAEHLWQQARVLIGKAVQRMQGYREVLSEQRMSTLREIGSALITTFDIEGLTDVLARQLPRLDIPSAYLALYEDPRQPTGPARLLLAYNEQGRIEIEAGGQVFPASQLVPQGLLPEERRYSMVVEPLYFREDQLGFVLFEADPREGAMYEALRGEISSALQGAALIRRAESHALQLQTAAEVSRAASSILDPEALIQQVVDLARERFDLYYAGLFLVDRTGEWTGEPGKWAVLRAGTGEAGQQMLEQGHKLEIGGTSMIGWCVANRKARIALDVGEEAVRFENPLLPETRSELALPLVSRGEAIGALTIQSTQEAAFSQEDITVLQTMADQLANAIGNARLYEALAREQYLMKALMDSVPDAIYFKDRESRFIRTTKAHAKTFGLDDPAGVIGKTDFDFFAEEHARQAYEDEQRIVRAGEPILGVEERETWPDRPDTWVLTSKMPLRDEGGNIVGTFGISSDITARKRVEEALAQEQHLLHALLDNVPDAIYYKDAESRFIRINRTQANRFGLSDPAEAMGKSDFDFFSDEHARPAYEDEQEVIRSGQPMTKEEKEVWPDGRVTWVSTTKMPLRDEAGNITGTFGVSRDVTARKEAEEALRKAHDELERYTARLERRTVELQAASEVAREATAILDVQQLLDVTVRLISDRFGFYHAGVFLVDEANEYAVLRAASSEGGRQMLERSHKLKVGQVGIVGYVTGSGEPRIALDVGEDAVFFDNPYLPDTRSEMTLPLRVRGRIIGALDVQSTEPAAFTEEDVTTLQTMADQLAIAIENARLVERTEAQLRELGLLYGEYSAAAWSRLGSPERPLGFVYDRVDVVPAEKLPSPALDMALQRGEVVTLAGPETMGTVLAMPLKIRDQTIGVMGVQEMGNARQWSPNEIALIEAVGAQVALALENARLFAEAQKTAQNMQALYETSRVISSSREEEAVMHAILEAVQRTLGCEHVLISTVDEETRTIGLQHGIWQGQFDVFPEWIQLSRYPLDHPDITADVCRTGQTQIIEGWDERFNREIYEKYGHERYLRIFMPIKIGDRGLGTIEVAYDRHAKGRVSEDEVQMLAAFMDQAAIALETAHLFEQIQRRAQRERQIFEITARIRRSPDIATILQATVDELGRALQADRTLVRLGTRPREEQ